MEYKIIPFTAHISQKDAPAAAAHQLEALIRQHATGGWEYAGLESLDTIVKGNAGCFGQGASPDSRQTFQVAVFRKNNE